jgi:hypothetical protein
LLEAGLVKKSAHVATPFIEKHEKQRGAQKAELNDLKHETVCHSTRESQAEC